LGEVLGHKLLDEAFDELNTSTQWNANLGKAPKGYDTMWFTKMPCNCPYPYGRHMVQSSVMSPILCKLLSKVKEVLGECASGLNAVNVNYYGDGNACIPWHADNEGLFGAREPILIASLSLGGERRFEIGSKDHVALAGTTLGHGDVLTMEGLCQHEVLHRVPKEKKLCKPRINLTFREVKRHAHTCPLASS